MADGERWSSIIVPSTINRSTSVLRPSPFALRHPSSVIGVGHPSLWTLSSHSGFEPSSILVSESAKSALGLCRRPGLATRPLTVDRLGRYGNSTFSIWRASYPEWLRDGPCDATATDPPVGRMLVLIPAQPAATGQSLRRLTTRPLRNRSSRPAVMGQMRWPIDGLGIGITPDQTNQTRSKRHLTNRFTPSPPHHSRIGSVAPSSGTGR